MKLVLAKWTADPSPPAGNLPEWSAQEAMNYLKQRMNGHGGIIVLNRDGHIGISHNTPRMAWAYKTVKKQESGIERATTLVGDMMSGLWIDTSVEPSNHVSTIAGSPARFRYHR